MHVELFRDFRSGKCFEQFKCLQALSRRECVPSAKDHAALPGCSHASLGVLADQRAFELRERGHHVEDQRATG